MSIILKALKKAEESKTDGGAARSSRAYQDRTKEIWKTVIAGIAATALLIAFGFYLVKGRTVSKTQGKPVNIQAAQSAAPAKKKEPKIADVNEAVKLSEDAAEEIKAKNYRAAEAILRKALLIKPDDAALHNRLGLALRYQSKYKEASAEYEKALRLKSDFYEAMNNLAVTSEMLGNREMAKALYKKAVSVKPSYAEAHLNYALLFESEDNNSEAESHYHTFLNLSSDETLKSKVRVRLRELKK